ncbi:hypothetical protein DL546_007314 [Coniochaeta pulveracea]|uniref:Uncharacterized protein n=1 Tax=Coniochaeta pulveracea TaxID=177199 RepID=A0A420YHP4_9PEZI|nr:hypothetical protein DL546_007314 [Coniochaeta pulveracea]
MDFQKTTTRLRRTFAYPTDETTSPDDSPVDALDETEQESLITTLSEQNTLRNAQFRRLLFALPALSAIPYLLNLFTLVSFMPSVLALTSLASTGWLLYVLPPSRTGIAVLDEMSSGGQEGEAVGTGGGHSDSDSDGEIRRVRTQMSAQLQRRRSRTSSFSYVSGPGVGSPLERWLPYLNLGLCGVLVLIGILTAAKKGRESVLADFLPVIVYGVVLAAKVLEQVIELK